MKRYVPFMRKLERWLLFALAFAIVAYLMLSLSDWSGSLNHYFFATENWESLVFVIIFVLVINFVLRKLLVWQFRDSVR